MTYTTFQSLDKFSQVEKTLEEGIAVSHRLEHDDFLELFHMGAFYVELRNLEKGGEMIAICHAEAMELVEPYLGAINIVALLQE